MTAVVGFHVRGTDEVILTYCDSADEVADIFEAGSFDAFAVIAEAEA